MKVIPFLVVFFFSCQNVSFDSASYNARYDDIDNSTVEVKDGSNQYFLHRCLVKKNNDTILITLRDTSKLSNWYEVDIIKVRNSFIFNCRNTFAITDSSYKTPILSPFNQLIKLNKTEFYVGDSIFGSLSFDISSYNQWPTIFTDTMNVTGSFHAIVQ